MAKIIQIQTNEKLLHILLDDGNIYERSLTTPDDTWKEIDVPILTGTKKNVIISKDNKPGV